MGRHHAALDKELVAIARGENNRLFVEMPPRHGKSMLTSQYFVAWYLGTYPKRHVIMAGANEDLATGFSARARDLLIEHGSGPGCTGLFDVRLRPDVTSKSHWELEQGGVCHAVGVGGRVFGHGADLLIVDDYHGAIEEALSQAERDKRHRWFHGTVENRLSRRGAVVIVATRYHPKDVIGRLKEEESSGGYKWRHLRFPALAEDNDPLGREPGEPLWPEVEIDGEIVGFGKSVLESKRSSYYASGYPWMWEALYQQNPPEVLDAEFDPAWFGEKIWFDDLPEYVQYTVMGSDPSMGATEKSYYSAIVKPALDDSGIMWVDADLDRRDPWKIAGDILMHARTLKPIVCQIESNAFQAVMGTLLEQRARELGEFQLPLRLVPSTQRKEIRIRSLASWLAKGAIRFRRTPGTRLLVDQLKTFPANKHDDGPDALERAVDAARWIHAGGNEVAGDSPFHTVW